MKNERKASGPKLIVFLLFVLGAKLVSAALTMFLFPSPGDWLDALHRQFGPFRLVNDLVLIAAILWLIRWAVRNGLISSGVAAPIGGLSLDALRLLVARSSSGPAEGVVFLSPSLVVCAISDEICRGLAISTQDVLGRPLSEVLPLKFAQELECRVRSAIETRHVSIMDVADWEAYGVLMAVPVQIVISPSFDEGVLLGVSLLFKNHQEQRQTLASANEHHALYQPLVENLSVGVGVFRGAFNAEGYPDGYFTEVNPALRRIFKDLPLPVEQPASVVWPTYQFDPVLMAGVSRVLSGVGDYRGQTFSPVLGKTLRLWLTNIGEGQLLVTIEDVTERLSLEQKVVQMRDESSLRQRSADEFQQGLLDEFSCFCSASSAVVAAEVESLTGVLQVLSADYREVVEAARAQHLQVLEQLSSFHDALTMPALAIESVDLQALVLSCIALVKDEHPDVTFSAEALSKIIGSQDLLAWVVTGLLEAVLKCPKETVSPSPRIVVGTESLYYEFMMFVDVSGFDLSELVEDVPVEATPLDWTISSDLTLARVRVLLFLHGGSLLITRKDSAVRLVCTLPGSR